MKKIINKAFLIFSFIFLFSLVNVQADNSNLVNYRDYYITKSVNVRDVNTNKILAVYKIGKYVNGYKEGNWIYFSHEGKQARAYSPCLTEQIEKTMYVKRTVNVRNQNFQLVGKKYIGDSIKAVKLGDYYRYYDSKDSTIKLIWHDCLTEYEITESSGYADRNINIRDSKTNVILGVLSRGEYISGHSYNNSLYFSYKGKEGKVYYPYILKSKPETKNYYVTKSVNIRSEANNSRVDVFYIGDYIRGEKYGAWVYFNHKGVNVKVVASCVTQQDETTLYVKKDASIYDQNFRQIETKTTGDSISGVEIGNYYRFYENYKIKFISKEAVTKYKVTKEAGYADRNIVIRDNDNNRLGVLNFGEHVSGYAYNNSVYFDYNGKEGKIYLPFIQSEKPKYMIVTKCSNIRNGSDKVVSVKNPGDKIYAIKVGDYYRFYENGVRHIWSGCVKDPSIENQANKGNQNNNQNNNNKFTRPIEPFRKTAYFKTDSDYKHYGWKREGNFYNFYDKNGKLIHSKEGQFMLVLDPGHGGGIKSNRGGLLFNEGDQNYKFALKIKEEAEKYYGVAVMLTRNDINHDPEMEDRAELGLGADLYISVHSNAAAPSVRGTELWASNFNRKFDYSEELVEKVSSLLNTNNRRVKYDVKNPNGSGYIQSYSPFTDKEDTWQVFKENTAREKFIIETVFHTNLEDSRVYLQNQDNLARLMMEITAKHFDLKKK